MEMIEEAYKLLYPDRADTGFPYVPKIKYTDQFKDYGANVRLRGNVLEFRLSRSWKTVSREIRIGLLQELMLKMFSKRKSERRGISTMHIDLYNNFVRSLHIAVPKTDIAAELADSFSRVNEKYFYGLVEMPNLVWGSGSLASLGSYDFKTDTIKISAVFRKFIGSEPELLDYVMYHEVLHKAHKYRNNLGKNRYHDTMFRKKEKQFENYREVDQKLKTALKRARIKRIFWFG